MRKLYVQLPYSNRRGRALRISSLSVRVLVFVLTVITLYVLLFNALLIPTLLKVNNLFKKNVILRQYLFTYRGVFRGGGADGALYPPPHPEVKKENKRVFWG